MRISRAFLSFSGEHAASVSEDDDRQSWDHQNGTVRCSSMCSVLKSRKNRVQSRNFIVFAIF